MFQKCVIHEQQVTGVRTGHIFTRARIKYKVPRQSFLFMSIYHMERLSEESRNLALGGKAASQHAGPSPVPGPPESQRAPGGEAATSGTALSGRKRDVLRS